MIGQSFENPAAAVTTLARIIQIGGAVLGGVVIFAGVLISLESYAPGAVILVSIIVGVMVIAISYITALILKLFAYIADNTVDCAAATRSCRYLMEDILKKEKKQVAESRQVMNASAERAPIRKETPLAKWICSGCGAQNIECDNFCNQCGKKKVD